MKMFVLLVLMLAAASAKAQRWQVNENTPMQSAHHVEQATTTGVGSAANVTEIKGARFVYSGIAVEAKTLGNPLQIINPWAPGTREVRDENVARDLHGKIEGLTLFAIHF